jgi:PAS domain S-box-containing protein
MTKKENAIRRSGRSQGPLVLEPKKKAAWQGSNRSPDIRGTHRRAVTNNLPAGVILVGPTGILLDANPAGVLALKADAGEPAVGRCVFPLVAPESREAFKALTKLVCNGEPGFLEFRTEALAGTPRWLEIYATPLQEEETGNTVMQGITHHITERKCNLEALVASEKRRHLLVEQAADGIFVVSSSTQKFIDANEQRLRMLDCDREELLSVRVHDFVDRADWGRLASHFRLLKPGEEAQEEWSCVPKRGASFPVEVKSRALDNGRIVGVLRDIREHKQGQQALRDQSA